ncbi:MAG: type II secretion system F family protein [Candidatus Eremiobacteraeota bacterium]|nr:type II secretion system F family protein [Candidatus Eremiobacteraeota bacterium]
MVYIFLRVGMASSETESPWFLGLLGDILFLAIFAQQIYDWTRARTESEDRALFLQEFADLVRLSIPPAEALAKLVEIRSKRYSERFGLLTRALKEVSYKVSAGESLAIAFHETPGIPDHWGSYAQFCEKPEQLAELLESLAGAERSNLHLPYLSALRLQILVPLMFGVNAFILVYILPTFIELFKGMNLQLPLCTRIMVGLHEFFSYTKIDWIIIIVSFILLLALSSEAILGFVFDVLYYVPGARNFVKLEGQSHAYRLIGAGLSFGVPQRECLQAAARTCRVRNYRNFLRKASLSNDSVTEQFAQAPSLFSHNLVWLLQQGEELENLPDAMLTASEVAHAELGERTRKVGVQMDTFVILLIGLYVGFCVLSMFLPIYMIIGNLG